MAALSPAHLHLDGVEKRFGARQVLAGVSGLAQGGLIAVLGPNGAGKTTLLRTCATVLFPDAGAVHINGLDPRREAERIEIRRTLGYLPQNVGFEEGMAVFDAVDYVAVLKQYRDERRRRLMVFDVLDRVGLRDRVCDRIGTLSGGMKRRLGIATALLGAPTMLVLDEPAAGLDPDERMRLREVLAERRTSSTSLIATHLTDEAAMCDTVWVFADGAIRFAGSPSQLAQVARGYSWVQDVAPAPDVRASWQLADGRFRCVGLPPAGAELVPPTLEDGYLLVLGDRTP